LHRAYGGPRRVTAAPSLISFLAGQVRTALTEPRREAVIDRDVARVVGGPRAVNPVYWSSPLPPSARHPCELRRAALGDEVSRLLRQGGPMLRARTRTALGAAATLALAGAAASAPLPKKLPRGVSPVLYELAVPAGSEPTPEKVALGDKLFNEKRVSVNDQVACATCHDPAQAFVDHKALAEGVAAPAQRTQRNSPTVLNAMFNVTQFWDGRAPTLEEQAKLPILNPIEMGQKSPDDVVAKVRGLPDYREPFQKVFGHEPTYDDIAGEIAAFERTLYAGDAPFDV